MGNGEGVGFGVCLASSVGVARGVAVGLGVFVAWVSAVVKAVGATFGIGVGVGAAVEATRGWIVGTRVAVGDSPVGDSIVDSESGDGAEALEQAMAAVVKNTKTINALRTNRLPGGGQRSLRPTPGGQHCRSED